MSYAVAQAGVQASVCPHSTAFACALKAIKAEPARQRAALPKTMRTQCKQCGKRTCSGAPRRAMATRRRPVSQPGKKSHGDLICVAKALRKAIMAREEAWLREVLKRSDYRPVGK